MVYLRYLGTGSLPNVPARDLSKDEVEAYGGEAFLVGSGLYQAVKKLRVSYEDKMVKPTARQDKEEGE